MARKNRKLLPLLSFKIPKNFMLSATFIIGIALGYGAGEWTTFSSSSNKIEPSSVRACFTPGSNCEGQIIYLISNAQSEILVQAYGFTSENLSRALLAAHNRGVLVKILYDNNAAKQSSSKIPQMQSLGIKSIPDRVKGIAHNKVMVIDKEIVITGSYNWSNAAKNKNSENIIIISNPEMADLYIKNWLTRSGN